MKKQTSHSDVPDVSVVIAAYNAERFLQPAIDSILEQTFKSFELIIVDDGSTDDTPEILKKYTQQDKRVRIFRQTNQGPASAANYGIQKSRAQLVARMDADDVSLPSRLQQEVDLFRTRKNLVLVGTQFDQIDVDNQYVRTTRIATGDAMLKAEVYFRCPFCHGSTMMRKSAFLKAGGYKPGRYNAEDYDLWIRMRDQGKFENIPTSLYQYRLSEESIMAKRPQAQVQATKKLLQKLWKSNPPTPRTLLAIYIQSMTQKHLVSYLPEFFLQMKREAKMHSHIALQGTALFLYNVSRLKARLKRVAA